MYESAKLTELIDPHRAAILNMRHANWSTSLPSECFYVCESHGTEGANRFNLPSLYRSVNVLSANTNGFSLICTEHAPLLTIRFVPVPEIHVSPI